jgi:triacylglycerol esterase/lipase EstA (alpha/beta hydrolase family)
MQGGYENKNSVLSMITTGTPHKGTPFGRIYDYLQQNCLPESAHKNNNGDCEDDWEALRWQGIIKRTDVTKCFIVVN